MELSNKDQIALTLVDDDDERHPVLLNVKNRHLFQIGRWLRKYKPELDDKIIFIFPDVEGKPSEIHIPIKPIRGSTLLVTEEFCKTLIEKACSIEKLVKITLKSRHLPLEEITRKSGQEEKPEVTLSQEGLYLGKRIELKYYDKILTTQRYMLPKGDLVQHCFIAGSTGYGKTVLGKTIIEEAVLHGIPSIVIDPAGDLSTLGLVFPNLRGEDFEPWIRPEREEEPIEKAVREADRHKKNLEKFGITPDDLQKYLSKVQVNVFTPKSGRGFRLAFSSFVEPPEDLQAIKEEDPDFFIQMIDSLAEMFVRRLGLKKGSKFEKAKGYLFELIKYAWEKGINLQGHTGLVNLIRLVEAEPPVVAQIGARQVDEYIDKKEREKLANEINNLLTGAAKLWFDGIPLKIDELVKPIGRTKKTPVNVININGLDTFEDKCFVISYVAFSIWRWMLPLGGTEEPRLLFYIDEIGGGGGRESYYPSYPYNPPTKPALQRLLKEGRKYGVCCIFATQNPKDFDVRGLSNCNTWMVSKLATDADRERIKEGASNIDTNYRNVERFIPSLDKGEFIIKPVKGENWSCFKERWLYCYHRALSFDEIGKLKEKYERKAGEYFERARKLFDQQSYSTAQREFEDIIEDYPYYSKISDAWLYNGKCLYELDKVDGAIEMFQKVLQKFYDVNTISQAQFYLGKCCFKKNNYSKAEQELRKVNEEYLDEKSRREHSNLLGYCLYYHRKFGEIWQWFKKWLWFKFLVIERCDKKELTEWPELATLETDGLCVHKPEGLHEDKIPELYEPILKLEPFELPSEGKLEKKEEFRRTEEGLEKQYQIVRESNEIRLKKARAFVEEGGLNKAEELYEKVISEYERRGLVVDTDLEQSLHKLKQEKQRQEQKKKEYLQCLDPLEFELLVADLYGKMGHRVMITKASRDGGVDLFTEKRGQRFVIQCKRWKDKINESILRDLLGTKTKSKVNYGVLVTTSDFTEPAREFARGENLQLINCEKLISMLLKSSA